MPISVSRYGDKLQREREPARGSSLAFSEAMTPTAVLERLSGLGCHSTDITDALYEADPGWTVKHDQEVRRMRGIGPVEDHTRTLEGLTGLREFGRRRVH